MNRKVSKSSTSRISGEMPKADITEYIAGIDFPATKAKLLRYAAQHNPPFGVLEALKMIPVRMYQDELDVNHALNHA